MVSSLIYRSLLLALLPVIAIVIYIEGQKYAPALIDFKSPDSGPGEKAFLFPREVDGFSQTGQVRTYSKENLYEYINGHAEYFIGAGFVSLSVLEYVKRGSGPVQPDVIVDVYDMGREIHAFGVLMDEAGGDPEEVNVGTMGIKTSQGLSFIKGQHYIKITAFNQDAPVLEFARAIDNNIAARPGSFELFSKFPDLGEVVATRFIKEAYRGLGFVNNALEREYNVKGETVHVFLVTGEGSEIERLTGTFLDFFRQSEIKYAKVEKYGRRFYEVVDPYEGTWYLLPSGDAMFGVYGAADDAILEFFSTRKDTEGTK